MSIHFRTLCEIAIAHAYYDGPCVDLDFVVPAATPALAAGRLLVRSRAGRLIVLYEADDLRQPVRDISGTTLFFGLRLVNPYFANFTKPPVAPDQLPLYANSGLPAVFDAPQAVRLLASRQRISPTLAGRPLHLRWQRAGQLIAEQTLPPGQDAADFATGDWPVGPYTLSEDDGGVPQQSHWLLHPELAGQALWGILALRIDSSFYSADPDIHRPHPVLTVNLEARSELLEYYVVARNYGKSEFASLKIHDAGADEQGRSPLVFGKFASKAFPADGLPSELFVDDSTQVVLFRSPSDVDRRAGGYRKLQLLRNSEVLIQHLPQAGSDRAQARFIVHLAKS
ncbi:MAG: hypothetical protein WAV95_04705 [Azonexus sp.]